MTADTSFGLADSLERFTNFYSCSLDCEKGFFVKNALRSMSLSYDHGSWCDRKLSVWRRFSAIIILLYEINFFREVNKLAGF